MDTLAGDAGLQALHRHLDSLETALHAGETGLAVQALDTFDTALRAWLGAATPPPSAQVLEALLNRQGALLLCMRDKQAEAAAALRNLEQSRRAAGAYRASATEASP